MIFNRSHYEDVLIVKVHDWIDDAECKRRYKQINDFECMLTETGTAIIKCYLHISKVEQKNACKKGWMTRQKPGNSTRTILRNAPCGPNTYKHTKCDDGNLSAPCALVCGASRF